MEHLFSPNSSTDLRSDAHQSQIVGGDTVKLLGGYIPHPLRVSAPLVLPSLVGCIQNVNIFESVEKNLKK